MPQKRRSFRTLLALSLGALLAVPANKASAQNQQLLRVSAQGTLESRGLSVLVFNNVYDGLFSDAKIAGIELIHHGERTVTNGDLRLSPTPGQWDEVPEILERRVLTGEQAIEVDLAYKKYSFRYTLRAESLGEGFALSVHLSNPVPQALEGKVGLNLEFLPSAYFRRTFLMDQQAGTFPLHPTSSMRRLADGHTEPLPLSRGRSLSLAPEDPTRSIGVTSPEADISLFDGRNTAQNGWFVARSLLPEGKTGKVLEWTISASTLPKWLRKPVIGHSQVGYRPNAPKRAILELDPNQPLGEKVRLLRVLPDGRESEVMASIPTPCQAFLRYQYHSFDFSSVREPGIYVLAYAGVRTHAFRIAEDVYNEAWHPALDVFLPVQMDHMFVNEAYRVWHGRPHRDDARQAPVNHEHFDLYAQGPTTDTRFQPGEHIPGLDMGGWFDAGDFDIRTQTQYAVVRTLVHAWEDFRPERDQTTIDHKNRHVELHQPDGVPDLLQQIEHGTLALIAQFRAVGHALNGIVEPDLSQYTHLGDASTKTDNLIYDPSLKPGEVAEGRSGVPDDRWAFTNKSTALNYGSIAALAAASRALKGTRDELAEECLETALRVWDDEHSHAPRLFRHGNTTGGGLETEELKAALELLTATGEARFAKRLSELVDALDAEQKIFSLDLLLRALPSMDESYRSKVREVGQLYVKVAAERTISANPYQVPITTGGWAGSGFVVRHAINLYLLDRAFPGEFSQAPFFAAVDYLYGCHPGSDLSLVSGVGTASKEVAYGNNRADFSFIAGGVVPGVLILKPDFPENKEDWPFFWGENEYVIDVAANHLYLALAASRRPLPRKE